MQPDDLSLALFASTESTDFRIAALTPEGAIAEEATLRLDELTPGASTPGFEQFSLLFTGPLQPLFPQGTYRFHHDALGERFLFMVPIGQSDAGTQYQVCISRKVD